MEKIKFSDPRITKTVELPSFKWSKVEVYNALTVWDQRSIMAKFPNSQDLKSSDAFSASIEMIAAGIKSWNFTDANDQDLEISSEILNKFPETDLAMLLEALTGKKLLNADNSTVAESEKKNW